MHLPSLVTEDAHSRLVQLYSSVLWNAIFPYSKLVTRLKSAREVSH